MIRLWRSEGALVNRSGHRSALRVMVLLSAVYLTFAAAAGLTDVRAPRLITGPMAWLLSASKDLGPAHKDGNSVAATLRQSDAIRGVDRLVPAASPEGAVAARR